MKKIIVRGRVLRRFLGSQEVLDKQDNCTAEVELNLTEEDLREFVFKEYPNWNRIDIQCMLSNIISLLQGKEQEVKVDKSKLQSPDRFKTVNLKKEVKDNGQHNGQNNERIINNELKNEVKNEDKKEQTATESCDKCDHYKDGYCEKLKKPIRIFDNCDYFKPKQKEKEQPKIDWLFIKSNDCLMNPHEHLEKRFRALIDIVQTLYREVEELKRRKK